MPKILTRGAAIILTLMWALLGSACDQITTSAVSTTSFEQKTTSPVATTPQTSTVPNVRFQSVTFPTNAKVSNGKPAVNFETTFRLVNGESFDVTVDWQVDSSINGKFDSGSVIVPKNGYRDVTKAYNYDISGPIKMTYSLKYAGSQIDSWSGDLNVTLPDIKIQSVSLPMNARVSSGKPVTNFETTFRLVNNESFDVSVDWQVVSSINGKFDGGSVIVPKNGFTDVTKAYYYDVSGTVTMTYSLKYAGAQIASWSGDMFVSP